MTLRLIAFHRVTTVEPLGVEPRSSERLSAQLFSSLSLIWEKGDPSHVTAMTAPSYKGPTSHVLFTGVETRFLPSS